MKEPRIACDKSSKLHIAFVYHHVIGDGLSGAAFHKSLLSELDNVNRNINLQETPKAIETPLSISMIEPLEKLTPLTVSALFLLKNVVHIYAPRWFIGALLLLWTGLLVQPIDKCLYRSRVRLITIEADKVGIILQES